MKFKMFIVILTSFAILASNVFAIPGQSHKFYGSVTINGQTAPDGTTVTAKINNVVVASTTTSQGKFGYPLYSFGVGDPDNNRAGKDVSFYVNDVYTGQTITFCNACFNLCDMYTPNCTPLSFSVAIATPQPPSGGGGGGGGFVSETTQTNQTETTTETTTTPAGCQEKWLCTDWSDCKNGIQTRTCNDENNCGTKNKEPFTSQPCSAEERKEAEKAEELLPTGFFLGLTTTDWVSGIVVGIIAAVVIIFLLTRKRKKRR